MDFLQAIILGTVQGLAEWLPISSSAINSLLGVLLFGLNFNQAFSLSLWLHLGTWLASIVYFRADLINLRNNKSLLRFLMVTTILTFAIGGPIFLFFSNREFNFSFLLIIIGVFLLITGVLQGVFRKQKNSIAFQASDAWLLGLVQGLAVLPGLSRSGLTTAAFLFKKYQPEQAFRLSFLMSIPVVFIGELLLGFKDGFYFDLNYLIAILFSFLAGILSIKALINIAAKLNFYIFVIILGILIVIGGIII